MQEAIGLVDNASTVLSGCKQDDKAGPRAILAIELEVDQSGNATHALEKSPSASDCASRLVYSAGGRPLHYILVA
jgi:hypothetical protein